MVKLVVWVGDLGLVGDNPFITIPFIQGSQLSKAPINNYTVVKVDAATPKKGGLVRGHY